MPLKQRVERPTEQEMRDSTYRDELDGAFQNGQITPTVYNDVVNRDEELKARIAAKDRRIAELEGLFPLMGCGSRAIPGTQHWVWLEARAMCRSNDIRWSDLEDADKDWSCVFSTQEACESAYKKSRKDAPHD